MTLGVFAQGSVNNSTAATVGAIATNSTTGYYNGPITVQVWFLNSATVPGNINSLSPQTAYNNMIADGFTQAGANFTSANITFGTYSAGELDIAGINRATAGGNAAFAIVAWNNNTTSSFTSLGAGSLAGVYAFENPTANYTTSPKPTPPNYTGWSQNLVLAAVPEPGTLALAGLGAAAFLIARRRKQS